MARFFQSRLGIIVGSVTLYTFAGDHAMSLQGPASKAKALKILCCVKRPYSICCYHDKPNFTKKLLLNTYILSSLWSVPRKKI